MPAAYGILGKKLSHSFSKNYFEKKFRELNKNELSYSNFEFPSVNDFLEMLSENDNIKGFNVTSPYKEEIIPSLTDLSDEAKEIGAVNCVKREGKKLTGFNTDVYGFAQSIKPFLDVNHQKALILGSGGAAKAVAFALKKIGVEIYFVTSSESKKMTNCFFYKELNQMIMNSFKLIVNATPLGMYPKNESFPNIPFEFLGKEHLCYDLIYNPEETEFLKRSKSYGAVTMNGLSMLHLQAEKSWEIWSDEKF